MRYIFYDFLHILLSMQLPDPWDYHYLNTQNNTCTNPFLNTSAFLTKTHPVNISRFKVSFKWWNQHGHCIHFQHYLPRLHHTELCCLIWNPNTSINSSYLCTSSWWGEKIKKKNPWFLEPQRHRNLSTLELCNIHTSTRTLPIYAATSPLI